MVALLDVSVLIALHYPSHEFHLKAMQWFIAEHASGWATCPITENGFVRIISQPSFPARVLSPNEASAELQRTIDLFAESHEFWPDDITVRNLLVDRDEITSREVTDMYLLHLAAKHAGTFATFDGRLVKLAERYSMAEVIRLIA